VRASDLFNTAYSARDVSGVAGPLLRIAALSLGFDDTNYPLPEFSEGRTSPWAAATTCNCSAGPPRPRSGPGSTPRRWSASPRGGTVTFPPGHGLLVTLHNVAWVTGVRTDGTARWDSSSGWVTAHLVVRYGGGPAVRLTARWRLFAAQHQPAVITGTAGSKRLAATLPGP
jgi:hypothetical protein